VNLCGWREQGQRRVKIGRCLHKVRSLVRAARMTKPGQGVLSLKRGLIHRAPSRHQDQISKSHPGWRQVPASRACASDTLPHVSKSPIVRSFSGCSSRHHANQITRRDERSGTRRPLCQSHTERQDVESRAATRRIGPQTPISSANIRRASSALGSVARTERSYYRKRVKKSIKLAACFRPNTFFD